MVSHNVTMLLPVADYVLQIVGGKLARSGLPKELKNVLLKDEEQTVEEEFAAMVPLATEKAKSVTTTGSTARRIYEEEKREQGNVKGMHYSFLVDNVGGSIYWIVFAALMLGAQISFFMTRVVLQWWTGDFDPTHLNYWLCIWGVLAIVRSIMSSARWFWLYGNSTAGFTQRAAARMHSQMLARLLRAPLRYFEKTPAGRILNRFSGDISCVDGAIPDAFGRSIMETLEFGSSVAALGVTVPVRICLTDIWFRPDY
jgi:ABC-type multidrug transport system fused ATPase/permease subunit